MKPLLLLADDDIDDCIFFQEALDELPFETSLITVNDGVELIELLTRNQTQRFDMLFLDLNMPRKNGIECLMEIKLMNDYQYLPIVIFSTSFEMRIVNSLYKAGAHYYIRKPGEFAKLRECIRTAITAITNSGVQPPRQDFILHKG